VQTDLAQHIQDTPLCDTHEHLKKEHEWTDNGPDILQDLFSNYVPADLVSAGASPLAMKDLMDASNPDLSARFGGIQKAWEAVQFTGYGEAVRLIASEIYGIEEITPSALEAAKPRLAQLRQPGERYRLLHDVANIDHIQTDDFCWPCLPDESGPDFFLYDLSWQSFCNGNINVETIHAATGIQVTDLDSLQEAMEALFAKYAPCAIAVKAQHAYNRTLYWQERGKGETTRALHAVIGSNNRASESLRLCLGDWCWARGVELSIQHNLPFKLHTGYYAGNNRMPVDRIRSGNLCGLLSKYLDARFVLMHIAYPYSDEVISLAKHYPNVTIDLCWAWSINPYVSSDFVRRYLHGAPSNKLFVFGGDTGWPTSATAYAIQTRTWFTRTLQAEIDDGLLTEPQAIQLATRLMHDNQYACFDLTGTRAAIQQTRIEKGTV
jgi:uncharacterized protein